MKPGPKPGYKQAPEHIERRKRFGTEHHHWKGETVSTKGGRTRALRTFKDVGPCSSCGSPKAERHHKDDNTANNSPENISILCRRCHMEQDGRLERFNFIDTADQYAKGESERITGRLISSQRDHWVLATKGGNRMGEGPNQVGLGRKWLMQACDDSLKRLGTDYIDIYYLHRDFDDAVLEETVGALGDLIRAGKARYFGLSNFRGWRIAEVMHLCRSMDVPAPVVCQPYYNAMNRQPEVEILPACRYYGIGVVPYSPLARGVLTGKYRPNETPAEGTRAGRKDKRMMETEFRKESLSIAQKIKTHAEKKGMAPGHLAVNWVLNNSAISSVIGGPRTLEQWQDYVKALEMPFDARAEALVDSLVATGHPSTPGYNDPQYPLAGRFPRIS